MIVGLLRVMSSSWSNDPRNTIRETRNSIPNFREGKNFLLSQMKNLIY